MLLWPLQNGAEGVARASPALECEQLEGQTHLVPLGRCCAVFRPLHLGLPVTDRDCTSSHVRARGPHWPGSPGMVAAASGVLTLHKHLTFSPEKENLEIITGESPAVTEGWSTCQSGAL